MKSGAPSRTAEYMALFRALESARPEGERLFEDRAAASFLRPTLRAVTFAARFPPAHSVIVGLIDHRWPGPRLSGVVRTRVIDDFVTGAMQAGCTQLVLLGAGYDTRATRLPAVAAGTVFEVDHPVTQASKRGALRHVPGRMRYVPLDFESDALQPALIDAGLDQSQRTCVLWEGVFSYLTPQAIDLTLAVLVEVCAPGSQILLTYVDKRYLNSTSPHAGAWLTAVHDAGEPFQTGLDPIHAPAFFAARNLTLLGDESTTQAARRLDVPKAHTIPDMYRIATLQIPQTSR
ncbi:MAG: SAM-dependent methyltransferase [Solirubrobacteraceae bacterium]|jgi:methyltransferase (TIGR00027 family)